MRRGRAGQSSTRTLAAMESQNRPADMLAELAAAEAAEAEALAEAARAEAQAARLRGEDVDVTADFDAESAVAAAPANRGRWSNFPWATFAASATAVLTLCTLVATGWMIVQHQQASARRAHDARFIEAASKGVVALLTIDHAHAKEDVQRVLDASTGAFRDDFAKGADDFIKTAEKVRAVTKGTIKASAVDSVRGDTAEVLLAVVSQVTNASGAREDPRPFRMSVIVSPDGDQLKMSKVEFVP